MCQRVSQRDLPQFFLLTRSSSLWLSVASSGSLLLAFELSLAFFSCNWLSLRRSLALSGSQCNDSQGKRVPLELHLIAIGVFLLWSCYWFYAYFSLFWLCKYFKRVFRGIKENIVHLMWLICLFSSCVDENIHAKSGRYLRYISANFFWIFRKILGWEREINTAPKPSPEVALSKMEVALF